MADSARVLFVDDEARVLTAMRAMFRRDYDVHLANSGAEALEVVRAHDIDVIVSDQRMPGMTGVKMLHEARGIAPRTMRILLTGYADLAAIEHAINEAEVFRYLMKPCPRDQLREVVAQAVEASRTAKLGTETVPSSAGAGAPETLPPPRPITAEFDGLDDVGFLVLSLDEQLADGVRDAVGSSQTVHVAASLDAAVEVLQAHPVGVVVTDLAVDEQAITALTAELRRQVPELVTIVASGRSDAHLMIELINKSQVFRFLLKPLSVGQSRIWLASAIARHKELLARPDAARRVSAEADRSTASGAAEDAFSSEDDTTSGLLGRVLGRIRGLRSRIAN